MTLDDYIAERSNREPPFKDALDALEPEYTFRQSLIAARLAAGLTQAELASRVGTKQPAIVRLETGGAEPSLGMLKRLASALNTDFRVNANATIEAFVRNRT